MNSRKEDKINARCKGERILIVVLVLVLVLVLESDAFATHRLGSLARSERASSVVQLTNKAGTIVGPRFINRPYPRGLEIHPDQNAEPAGSASQQHGLRSACQAE